MAEKNLSINVRVNTETGQLEVLGAKLKGAAEEGEKSGKSFLGMSSATKELFGALGNVASVAGIIAFFKEAFNQAKQDEDALRRLQFAVEANGKSWATAQPQIEAWAERLQATTRFSDTDALEALGKLSKATKNTAEAQHATEVAMGLVVQAGMPMNEALDLMQGLMLGNERAISQARRELGNFTGGATNAQGILDNLSKSFGESARQEEGAAKASAQFKNAWDDFAKLVGQSLMPAFTGILNFLTMCMNQTEKVGTVVSAVILAIVDSLQNMGKLMVDVMTGNFKALIQHTKEAGASMANIWDATADQFKEIEAKKTKVIEAEAAKKPKIHAQASAQDLKAEAELANKILAIKLELTKKMDAIGIETYEKKLKMLEAEYEVERQKIIKEVEDKKKQVEILQQLDAWKAKQGAELARLEAVTKRDMLFDTVDTALQGLSIVNSMSEKDSQGQVNRAMLILALEKAIAIARILSSPTMAIPGVGQALGAAQIALIVAQFAAQTMAIKSAASQHKAIAPTTAITTTSLTEISPGNFLNQTTGDIGGFGDSAGNQTAGGTIIIGKPSASSAGGGTGQTINVNIPVINIRIDLETLEVADRRRL
ncbi:MAG: hypothetical protein DMF62_02445, partial [Acidobacteria bacterium]